MENNNVLVLMSTYNGERYLKEQLDSLIAQTGVDLSILIRDDGSSDNTLNILNEYKCKHNNIEIIKGTNIGAARSFYELSSYAFSQLPPFEYYAFCDQDDVWHSSKLYNATKALDNAPKENKLYFCRANFVDSNLNYIKKTAKVKYYDYTTCVYRNPALGCTMTFDRVLLSKFLLGFQKYPSLDNLHDAWMFKCAIYTEATVISDDTTYIDYRQHGNNVTLANKGTIHRYVHSIKRKFKRRGFYGNILAKFYEVYKDYITDKSKLKFLEQSVNYRKTWSDTLIYLNLQSWKTESKFDKLIWQLLVLFRFF